MMLTPNDPRRITVEPIIDLLAQLGPSSLDVRLGYEFRIINGQHVTHIDPLEPEMALKRTIHQYTSSHVIDPNPSYGKFILHPGELVLASTLEHVELPADISATIEGRSSLGRLGLLVHSTAGFIDPGFRGTITYELVNLGKLPIPLYPGVRVAQLTFEQLAYPAADTYSDSAEHKYSMQRGPVASRFFNDIEYKVLSRIRSRDDDDESERGETW